MNFEKPRYRWNGEKGKYIIMANEVARTESAEVPQWMRAASTGASMGNIDQSDLKPPRLKILAGQSPEIMDRTPGAQVGNFWMTILNMDFGPSVSGTPIFLRKSYQLWAPKGLPGDGGQKGPLATASDGIHWDVPNQVFEVRFPGNPRVYKWRVKSTVFENKMHKFGSSQDDNPNSKPAATLTYDVLWLIDLPNGKKQLCVFTNARTGIGPTQNFISTARAMGVDQYFQRYKIVSQRKTGPTGDPYYTYEYQYLGNLQTEAEGIEAKALYDQYAKSGFVTDFEAEAETINADKPSAGRYANTTQAPAHDQDDIPF